MRIRIRGAALFALALATAACSDDGALNPRADKFDGAPQLLVNADPNGVRISEIHYDNTGADTGEAVEVSAPAGQDFAGWRIYLYNGNGGASYHNALIPIINHTVCGTRKVAVLNIPAATGFQNGAPDGLALVDNTGTLVEFLSYEGTFTGVGGPANGVVSTDIGVAQLGNEPIGHTLQRISHTNDWVASPAGSAGKFGECNDNGPPPPPPVVASVTVIPATATIDQGQTQQFLAIARDANGQTLNNVTVTWSSSATAIATIDQSTGLATGVLAGSANIIATAPNGVVGNATLNVNTPLPPNMPNVRFSEIHYDNFGTDVGEAIELEGPAGTDLTGWSIVLYNGSNGAAYDTRILSGAIDGSCTTLAGRGIAYFEYPSNGIQNGPPDGMALVDASGQVVEFLSYEGTMTATDGAAAGKTSTDIVAFQNSAPAGQTLQRNQNNVWAAASSTIGGCNSGGPINRANFVTFSGRLTNDPPLPVDFEDQVFATLIDASTGATIPTTFTWTSETPAIASVDQDGVVRAVGAGNAVIRATAADGSTGTHTLPTVVATASATAQYGNHIEFGAPADMDNSDDFIVVRPQFISSFNKNTNIPNWAAYNLEQTHFGTQPRCDCFTYDPQLPASFTRYTTADYTGAGAHAGYGIDRGHLVRSFDREAGNLDNATTYYFTNIVPQAADNNQGPWGAFETFLGNLALSGSSEVYIIAGASGSKGTVKDEGIITIPSSMWKVAIVMPRNQGLANVDSYDDVQVFAVIMPNDPGIRSVQWQTYQKTVDDVETLSGYNLLALLPDHIELAVESNTKPPVGVTNGPFASNEGASVSFSAAGSSDADGHALTYAWSFGDGTTATGSAATHTYAQDGTYNVQLVVTDALGLADTVNTTATVANVAPAVAAFNGAVLLPGETYNANGSFTDPGADTWAATVDYGDGSGVQPLTLTGKTFSLTHTYNSAGSFVVTVTVQDDDTSTPRTQTITVLTADAALQNAGAIVAQLLADRKIGNGTANSFQVKLDAARAQIAENNIAAATGMLQALVNEIDGLIGGGRLSAADAALLRSEVLRVMRSINL